MPLHVDRYPELGPKVRISGFEDALDKVRARYPAAYAEGSTGSERTWFVGRPPDRRHVAHHWETRVGGWWLRMTDDLERSPTA